jgi:hypothetical protein
MVDRSAGQDGKRRKLIIFTEHRDTLNYLWERMSTLFGREDNMVYIDGSVPRKERRAIEDRFRNDPNVHFLLATEAAAEGINLQRAHLMINYDLPWNPNRLEQRFGRIHRIGQTEVCHLWNLVAGQTREGYVYRRLLSKLETESKGGEGEGKEREEEKGEERGKKRRMGIGWLPAPAGPKTPVPETDYTIPFGKADVKREGADVTIVTLGLHVHRALDAAGDLADEGIDAEVIDLRSLVPLDTETVVESVRKTGRLVVVDEDYQSFGVTGEIVARVAEDALADLETVERLAIPDVPIPYSRPLENEVVPDTEDIAETVRQTQ